jgi:hypothetical protein
MKITVKITVSDGQGEDGSGGTKTQPSDPGKNLAPVLTLTHSLLLGYGK